MLTQPIQVREACLHDLPKHYYDAANHASDFLSFSWDVKVRIETYHMEDVIHTMQEVWKWSSDDFSESDKKRVETIRQLLIGGQPRWPYVSHWAYTMKELHETNEDGMLNHGDGFHRLYASIQQNYSTMEFLFFLS